MKIVRGMMETCMTCGILAVREQWELGMPLCRILTEDPGTGDLGRPGCVTLWHPEDDYMLFFSSLKDAVSKMHRRKQVTRI